MLLNALVATASTMSELASFPSDRVNATIQLDVGDVGQRWKYTRDAECRMYSLNNPRVKLHFIT